MRAGRHLRSRPGFAFRAAGLRVWAWTVTAATTGQHKSLWDMGVAGVFTDVPGEARAVHYPA